MRYFILIWLYSMCYYCPTCCVFVLHFTFNKWTMVLCFVYLGVAYDLSYYRTVVSRARESNNVQIAKYQIKKIQEHMMLIHSSRFRASGFFICFFLCYGFFTHPIFFIWFKSYDFCLPDFFSSGLNHMIFLKKPYGFFIWLF